MLLEPEAQHVGAVAGGVRDRVDAQDGAVAHGVQRRRARERAHARVAADLAAARLDGVEVRLVHAHDEAAAAVRRVDGRAGAEARVLLAAPDEGGLGAVDRAVAGAEHERSGPLGQRPRVVGARAHRDPLGAQARRLEVVAGRRVLALALHRDRIDDGPAVDPAHGGQEGLAPEDVDAGDGAGAADAEQHHPPRAVGGLDEVGVAGVLHRVVGAAVAEDRVVRAALERPGGRGAARDRDRVARAGAALGDEQVPGAVELVEVRRLGELQPGARPQRPRLLQHAAAARIDAHLLDLAADGVQAGAAELRVGQPAGALGVPGEVGVDADGALDGDRVRPRAARVLGGVDDVPALETLVVTSQKSPS